MWGFIGVCALLSGVIFAVLSSNQETDQPPNPPIQTPAARDRNVQNTSSPPSSPPPKGSPKAPNRPPEPKPAAQPKDEPPPTPQSPREEWTGRLDEIAKWSADDYDRIAKEEGWDHEMKRDFEAWLMRPEHWDKTCNLTRDITAQDPRSARTFDPSPEAPPSLPVWLLRWQGVSIPIPAIDYERLRIYRNNKTLKPTFFLYSGSETLSVLIAIHPDEPFEHAFPRMEPGESRELTNQAFGNDGVSFEELVVKGYENTSKDITCEPDQWKRDASTVASLQTKNLKEGDGIYNFPNTPGWVWKRRSSQKTLWDGRLFPLEIEEELTVAYSVINDTSFSQIGLMVGRVEADTAPARPLWLDALGRALTTDSPADWQALDNALQGGSITTYEKTF